MFAPERLRLIRQAVRRRGRIGFPDLQKLVDVSAATLRRDLATLEKAGEIVRVHGGVLDPAALRAEPSLDERAVRQKEAKRAIAAAAAALVPAGATVFVDAGSTCLEAGLVLLRREDVTLVTHSIRLVAAAASGRAALICIGGALRKVSGALTGGNALRALEKIHADVAFIGASGLSAVSGASTTELSEAEIKMAGLVGATRRILLADSSKWERPSTIQFAAWTEFTDWVCERDLSPAEKRELRAPRLTLHRA